MDQRRDRSHIFNAPAKGRPRAEHHRPSPPPPASSVPSFSNTVSLNGTAGQPTGGAAAAKKEFKIPTFVTRPSSNNSGGTKHEDDEESAADLILQSPKAAVNFAPPQSKMQLFAANEIVYHPRKQIYSTNDSFTSANAWKGPQKKKDVVDLTGISSVDTSTIDAEDEAQMRDADRALGIDSRFGAYDPTNYIDAEQASENIKALLEGAFEDEEVEKLKRPRRRRRSRSSKVVDNELAEKMGGLAVDSKESETEKEKDEDEVEEQDDGFVDGLKTKLLPHQIDGVAWMVNKEIGKRKKNGVLPKGGILADDMGLGKTVQALALILSNPRPAIDASTKNTKQKISDAVVKSTLVVAPLALIKQWEGEVKSKIEESRNFKVLVHHGPTRTKRFEDLKKYDMVVTTYQTLTSEHAASSPADNGAKIGCFGLHWYRIILDEAHTIKNRNAKLTKAAYALKSVYRWCLSGTPMQNNLDELQSLIRFLDIKPYCSLGNWRDQISEPMKSGRGGIAMRRLQFFLKAFMMRRTKDVLKKEGGLSFGKGNVNENGASAEGNASQGFKIVNRKVETIVVDFSESERSFYDDLADRAGNSLNDMIQGDQNGYIGALVLLLRLRQTCNHPELIRASLSKEKDAMPAQSPRDSADAPGQDMDDIADMLGGLSMETKKCDVCRTQLDRESMKADAVRCRDCEKGLSVQVAAQKRHKHEKEEVPKNSEKPKRRAARRVIDSDEEDESEEDEGEWIVPEKLQTKTLHLGKAGGSDDEDAEGGGEWLGADDSFTDHEANDDSMSRAGKFSTKKKVANNGSDDDDDDDSRYFSNSDDDDDDDNDNDDDEERTNSTHEESKSEGPEESGTDGEDGPVASTKIRKLIEILKAQSNQYKFIVFSEFTSMLDMVEPFLRRHRLQFTRYDGKMRNNDREASLDRLRNDPQTRILLCSLRCGSLGLNLTAASRVVILEPFWNPFVEEQAIDRVHRLNQTQDVVVYRLTIANSVEERILDLQEKKRELAKVAIEGGKAVGKLNMQDILQLFRRDAELDSRYQPSSGSKDQDYGNLGNGRSNGLLSGVASSSPAKPKSSGSSKSSFNAAARQRQNNAIPPSLKSRYDAIF